MTRNYLQHARDLIERIERSQSDNLARAAAVMAETVESGGWVNLFGSGHSVIPVLDVFPRYGSFVGFRPLMDPRLMWFNVIGPGGAPELLWLEREEGYVRNFLKAFEFSPQDAMVIYSHGGLNAAGIEAALYVKERGVRTIAVTSVENQRERMATHSSGRKLSDVVDIVIDNCVPPEDALVNIGRPERLGAGSTLAVVAISMTLVVEVGKLLAARGHELHTFVSPNVPGVSPDHNENVFERYRRRAGD